MGEGRIEEIIRLGCYCISVAGKPVGVRIPPFGTIAILKGRPESAGFPFFAKSGRVANLWLAVLILTSGATDWNIFPASRTFVSGLEGPGGNLKPTPRSFDSIYIWIFIAFRVALTSSPA